MSKWKHFSSRAKEKAKELKPGQIAAGAAGGAAIGAAATSAAGSKQRKKRESAIKKMLIRDYNLSKRLGVPSVLERYSASKKKS
jgi:hypothetical protein